MKRFKVLQLQLEFNVKQHAFADLAEQIVLAMPEDEFEVVSGFLSGKPVEGESVSRAERSVYFEFENKALKGLRLKALWDLYKFCRAEKFDLIIAHRFKPISMLLLLRKWLKGCFCIGVFHRIGDFDRSYRQRQIRKRGQEGWHFVGVSEAVRSHLIDYQCGFTTENTSSITNAIDVQEAVRLQVSREVAREKLGLPQDALVIGALGRLVPIKGHRFLIDAFDMVKNQYENAHLAIIGEGREREEIEQQIDELGIEDRVHLVGFQPDALQYVQAFDIWTMPSLNEGLGLALLEGMCGSLPVIASDVPAMRPLIKGAGGACVPPGDVEALSDALSNYMSLSAEQRQVLGDQCFSYLVSEHGIGNYRAQYLSLVKSILLGKRENN